MCRFKNYLGNTKIATGNVYVYPDAPRIPPPPLAHKYYRSEEAYTAAALHVESFFTEPYCANSDGQALGDSGWGDVWSNNTCVMYGASMYNFGTCDAANPQPGLLIPTISGNRFYSAANSYQFSCGGKTLTLSQAQAVGVDIGSSVSAALPIQQIVTLGMATITN